MIRLGCRIPRLDYSGKSRAILRELCRNGLIPRVEKPCQQKSSLPEPRLAGVVGGERWGAKHLAAKRLGVVLDREVNLTAEVAEERFTRALE